MRSDPGFVWSGELGEPGVAGDLRVEPTGMPGFGASQGWQIVSGVVAGRGASLERESVFLLRGLDSPHLFIQYS